MRTISISEESRRSRCWASVTPPNPPPTMITLRLLIVRSPRWLFSVIPPGPGLSWDRRGGRAIMNECFPKICARTPHLLGLGSTDCLCDAKAELSLLLRRRGTGRAPASRPLCESRNRTYLSLIRINTYRRVVFFRIFVIQAVETYLAMRRANTRNTDLLDVEEFRMKPTLKRNVAKHPTGTSPPKLGIQALMGKRKS